MPCRDCERSNCVHEFVQVYSSSLLQIFTFSLLIACAHRAAFLIRAYSRFGPIYFSTRSNTTKGWPFVSLRLSRRRRHAFQNVPPPSGRENFVYINEMVLGAQNFLPLSFLLKKPLACFCYSCCCCCCFACSSNAFISAIFFFISLYSWWWSWKKKASTVSVVEKTTRTTRTTRTRTKTTTKTNHRASSSSSSSSSSSLEMDATSSSSSSHKKKLEKKRKSQNANQSRALILYLPVAIVAQIPVRQ